MDNLKFLEENGHLTVHQLVGGWFVGTFGAYYDFYPRRGREPRRIQSFLQPTKKMVYDDLVNMLKEGLWYEIKDSS